MKSREVTLSRWLAAPRERVFDAFTQPDAICEWMGPEVCTVPRASIDLRIGGRYRIEIHAASGDVYLLAGEYLEIERPSKLSFTWRWLNKEVPGAITRVTVLLAEQDGGTRLDLRHEGFDSDDDARAHDEGWVSTVGCLERMLAGQPKVAVVQPVVVGDPRSTYVRSARMVFVEKGIAYRLEPAPPHGEVVNALHPYGRVPALRCGDVKLFETSAILRYVDDKFPGPPLVPDSPLGRARMEQWISAINGYMYGTFVRELVLQYVFPRGAGGKPERAVIDAALPQARRHLELLDQAYGEDSFLVGDSLSLVDLLLAPIVHYVVGLPEGDRLIKDLAGVQRGLSAMRERASMRDTDPSMAA